MADDFCRPHIHYNPAHTCTLHHYYPTGEKYRCSSCGNVVQSVVTRDLARKHKDRHAWRT